MTTFHLTVVTPDGCAFDGQAERVVCRAIDGDLAILAKHGDYCTALGMGEAHIVDADGQRRRWLPPGSGRKRSTRPAPRLPKSAPRRFWPRRTSTSATTRWPRPASSAHWCVPPSTDLLRCKNRSSKRNSGFSYECRRGCRCGIGSPFLYGKITAYLPSRSDCGCGGPASRWRWCFRRRWAR